MTQNPNDFTHEISDALAATGEDYTTTAIDLGDYGTSYEITKHGSDRQLHLTPLDDDLIDMALYDGKGKTIASGIMFHEVTKNLTTEEFSNLIAICF